MLESAAFSALANQATPPLNNGVAKLSQSLGSVDISPDKVKIFAIFSWNAK